MCISMSWMISSLSLSHNWILTIGELCFGLYNYDDYIIHDILSTHHERDSNCHLVTFCSFLTYSFWFKKVKKSSKCWKRIRRLGTHLACSRSCSGGMSASDGLGAEGRGARGRSLEGDDVDAGFAKRAFTRLATSAGKVDDLCTSNYRMVRILCSMLHRITR